MDSWPYQALILSFILAIFEQHKKISELPDCLQNLLLNSLCYQYSSTPTQSPTTSPSRMQLSWYLFLYSIGQLSNLERLEVSGNGELTSLPESLFRISILASVNCYNCVNLTSPPRALCKTGVKAVKKYFDDLKLDKASNQRLIPVTVIGKSRAGKTSLVESMHENESVLKERSSAARKLYEATKVFEVC